MDIAGSLTWVWLGSGSFKIRQRPLVRLAIWLLKSCAAKTTHSVQIISQLELSLTNL